MVLNRWRVLAAALLGSSALAMGCSDGGSTPAADAGSVADTPAADTGPADAGRPPREPSELYGPCASDSECQQALANPAYSCVPGPLPTCLLGCAAPADCVTASVLTDADNWACEADHCKYLGCQSAAECQQGLANANYTCE